MIRHYRNEYTGQILESEGAAYGGSSEEEVAARLAVEQDADIIVEYVFEPGDEGEAPTRWKLGLDEAWSIRSAIGAGEEPARARRAPIVGEAHYETRARHEAEWAAQDEAEAEAESIAFQQMNEQ